jgi:two-component system nitrogen regulation sensor histidine kinase NtrY
MDIREQLRQHRKDNRLILASLGVLMLLLTGIYYLIQHSRDLPAEVINSRVILFVLWYVDVVLALAFVFILGRSLYKLFVERSRFLGSKFKFKLVATNIGLSLIPVLLLYLFATQLLQGSLDRLFSTDVKQALEQGSRVVDAMNDRIERTAARDANRVSQQIRNLDLQDLSRRPAVSRRLQQLLDDLGDDYLAVYENGEFIHAVVNPQSGLDDLEEPPRSFLQEALAKGHAIQVRELPGNGGRLVFAGVASKSADGTLSRVVVSGSFVDPLIASQGDLFIRAFQGYRQLELQMNEVRASYLLTMLLVTLIILSAMLWIGLRLTQRVTAPIQALAEGTRQVSQGDLAYRVDVEADDELGVLVDSFNKMTAELQRSKNLLEESYQELVKTNRQVAEERARVAAVLENLAAGVISVDAEGRVLTCNDAALQLLEQRDVDVIGRPVREVWSSGELYKLVGLFESEDEVGRRREEVRLLLDGDWKTFEAKVTSMRNSTGKLIGQVMVLEDLTELIKAQQLAAWNDAARRIAHEIKNPLTPIKLSAERLLKKHRQGNPNLGDALEEAVEIIGREVESMKGMVDEFSRFARMPRPQPSEVDIQRLVDDVLQLYRDVKPGVEISSRVAPELPHPVLDGEQIRGALINLLDNAIEATEAPGRVHVGVSSRDGTLRIKVADTGHGVSPEAREQLFLPHFSTKRRGSGLGLAIVHRIVTDHRGTIRVEDNRPSGTIFTLELPLT